MLGLAGGSGSEAKPVNTTATEPTNGTKSNFRKLNFRGNEEKE